MISVTVLFGGRVRVGVITGSDSFPFPHKFRTQEDMEMSDAELSVTPDTAGIPVQKGDIVTFGRFPYWGEKDRTPVEWLVLDITEETFGKRRVPVALLISRYGLFQHVYHVCGCDGTITWEFSHLRKWLNRNFVRMTFSGRERQLIFRSRLKNEGNPEPQPIWMAPPERDTWDRVFCLSPEEAERYFAGDSMRSCRPTPYAVSHGSFTDRVGNCFWWLRAPGDNPHYAACVRADGSLYFLGFRIWLKDATVRPALRIMLLPESGYCQRVDSPEPEILRELVWRRKGRISVRRGDYGIRRRKQGHF